MDREKVIKGLECCTKINYGSWGSNYIVCFSRCPYFKEVRMEGGKCIAALKADALTLLKEQEKRINELEEKLRLLEYGDQDILESGLMPAT